jgi:DHA1 family inner membrane transport protein
VALIGALAFVVIAVFVPSVRRGEAADSPPAPLRDELAVLGKPQVLLGLAMTVLGYAGVFTVFTYIQPLLTQVSGVSASAVSPILLVFGSGLAVGNLLGGRLADRAPMPAVLGTLAVLTVVLGTMQFVIGTPWMAVAFVGVMGVAAFATVAPMQLRVLEKAAGPGQNLASSLNIAAFNLGNALGAWVGGVAVESSLGLSALGWIAALITLLGLGVALGSHALDQRTPRPRPASPARNAGPSTQGICS